MCFKSVLGKEDKQGATCPMSNGFLFTHKETGVTGEETDVWDLVCVKMNGFPKIKDGQKLGLA